MDNFEEITLTEEIESKNVKKELEKWRKKRIWFSIISFAIILISLCITPVLSLILGICFLFGLIYYTSNISYLNNLHKIAKHNDMVRHDEMVRARERARLEEINYQPEAPKNNKEINKTLENLNINKKTPKLPNIKK